MWEIFSKNKKELKTMDKREFFTFKEYQENVKTTRSVYVEAIDRLVYGEHIPGTVGIHKVAKMLRLSYVALGLGEVGEIQGKIKKLIRDSEGVITADHVAAISKELGDLLWYVSETCTNLGLDMGRVALENNEKLASRKERGVLGGSGDNR